MNVMSNEHGPDHEREFHIVVNGRPKTVHQKSLNYDDVVRLAFPDGPHDESTIYTVSYAKPHGHDGTLAKGQSVEVKDGMSFNVGKTSRS
jgi:Multiubiquitin